MYINPSDLAFVVSMLDKARYYNDRANAHGVRRLIIDVRSGVRTANRFGSNVGATPHPSSRRWRIRVRGTDAEALLAVALPHMSTAKRERAEAALARVNEDAA